MASGRVYKGSPLKVSGFQNGAAVYKMGEEPLGAITYWRIVDEVRVLAALGVSRSVLVSEALEKLGEEVNPVFQSIAGMAERREDVQLILDSVKSAQGKGSFSRFAFGIFAGVDGGEQAVIAAIERNGFQTFKEVINAVAEDNKENSALVWLARDDPETRTVALMAWAKAFVLLEETHPFDYIGGDVELAEEAVQLLSDIGKTKQRDDEDVLHLIQAAVPLLQRRVVAVKAMAAKLEVERQARRDVICKKLGRMRIQITDQRGRCEY